jgi:hypothetical protein
MKRSSSVSRRWMKSSAGAAAHGGRWVGKQAREEKSLNKAVQCGSTNRLLSLSVQYKSTNIFLWLCRREGVYRKTGGGVPPVRLAQVVVSESERWSTSSQQHSTDNVTRNGVEKCSAYAAVHDRITTTNYGVHTLGKAHTHAVARSV